MEPTTTQVVLTAPPLFDEVRLSVGGFLARYSGKGEGESGVTGQGQQSGQ
jgi:hypothetical protein